MSVAYGKGPKGKATRLHSQIVRARAGRCLNCRSTRNLQCAHIIGRNYAHTRTDLNNAFCLCATCHRRFTDHADEWLAFVDKTIGREKYDALKAKAERGVRVKFDWVAEAARLQEVWDHMKAVA